MYLYGRDFCNDYGTTKRNIVAQLKIVIREFDILASGY